MTLHPIFADILEKHLGVKMCDDELDDDVDYDYPVEEDEDCEDTFSNQRKEHGVKVL